jgi:hypothetical protein
MSESTSKQNKDVLENPHRLFTDMLLAFEQDKIIASSTGGYKNSEDVSITLKTTCSTIKLHFTRSQFYYLTDLILGEAEYLIAEPSESVGSISLEDFKEILSVKITESEN